ncbi:hypothetical protein A2765_06420 [Candidatus Kaiserbacteria bacterium RIFCSPHIGHO2_01_FULL_56_24]|uniref:Uncharacterized protein n=1 Tax=Candidatus Kaiserbacteria bacterium RIFCSPHIGHO2_01_FULL_56_24 TaxID=1798487 RepID=A0A1F6DGL8_9BACT|nr:MAG: hypothetical protein A2765_06420 [Candidatus Kaiserbacteria bacterium RIFCSPHIGHO2_01_FULL_56_24]
MSDYHVVIAVLAAIVGVVAFVPYFLDVLRGTTKPHVFTWAIWSLLTGITFLIQLTEGGGPGAWVTGIESLSCIVILIFTFSRGEKNITRSDWICFIAALIAIALWLFAHQPLTAIALVIFADILGYVPTFRKSYAKPQEETAMLYSLSAAHWLLSIVGLESLTLVTALYPSIISVFDVILVAMLLIRRRQLNRKV